MPEVNENNSPFVLDIGGLRKELSQRAKAVSRDERRAIIDALKETELHEYLKELFKAMQPDYTVEITHGVDELGKDLVIVKKDAMTTDVIGVVVKRGSVMASTLGDVEEIIGSVNEVLAFKPDRKYREIESQIKQAFKHKAELKTRFNKLPVDKVFVVLSGDISKRGRNRLDTESEGPVEIFDIDWLIDNFTNYYPQIFFEGKVTDFLQSKIQELETKSWHVKQNKNLSDCYVEPLVSSVDAPIQVNDATIAAVMSTRRLPFSKLKSVISSKQQIILIGDAGTGKSAALAKLSIEMLREAYSCVTKQRRNCKNADVPILVTGLELLTLASAEDLLLFYFGDRQVAERLTIGILMVDALDEVSAQLREELIKKAKSYAETLGCALLLTSRKIDILSSTPPGFKKYELLPFEAGQALKLFEKLHGKDQLLQSLKVELNKIRHQIPMVPLSLILLMELVEENKEVPASITELYERFTDIVLGRHERKKGIESLFEYTIKKRFLAALAYREFLSKGQLEISKQGYITFLNEYASEYSLDHEYIAGFVREIERAGILRIDEEDVSFGHRSFLDYFAGFYIFDKRDEIENIDDHIVQNYFDDLWGDTVFFYIGHRRELSEKLLNRLFSYKGNKETQLQTQLDKFGVGKLLQAGWHSTTKSKNLAIEQAFDLVPEIRQSLIEFSAENKWRMPKIFADYIITLHSDHSFRSNFIFREMKTIFEKWVKEERNILSLVPLLWAIKPFLSKTEMSEYVGNVLDTVTKNKELSAEGKARALIMLQYLERDNRPLAKSIKKQIERFQNKNPGIMRNLLPAPTKGSMLRTKKRENRG